jgi:hypothetical protein
MEQDSAVAIENPRHKTLLLQYKNAAEALRAWFP